MLLPCAGVVSMGAAAQAADGWSPEASYTSTDRGDSTIDGTTVTTVATVTHPALSCGGQPAGPTLGR